MPSPQAILEGLTHIANDAWLLALVWHLLVAAVIATVIVGRRPDGRVVGLASSALPASVSAMAWAYGNPFNGAVFALLGASFAAIAARAPRAPVTIRDGWQRWIGVALVAFGWLYPHFLEGSPAAYLVAAPLGLVPCPTLSMMLGIALVGLRPAGSAWAWLLVGAASFYALVGAARLGVWIDLVMLVGAGALAAAAWSERRGTLVPRPA